MSSQRRPLTSRWLDLVYFIYFTTHIPATVLVDTTVLFINLFDKPPYALTALADYYIETYNDPLFTDNKKTWFKTLEYIELFLHTPFFFYAAIGLWKDSPSIRLPFVIYSSHVVTATGLCIAEFIFGTHDNGVSDEQRTSLILFYLPYLIIPAICLVDSFMKVRKSEAVLLEKKNE